jgi:hypothetical protein
MMIGGRNLGGPCDTGASVDLWIDGRRHRTWTISARSPFLEVVTLAPGVLRGHGGYARVEIKARDAAATTRAVDVAIEHFDVQSAGATLAGFDRGWHMPELDPSTGLAWRWTEGTADLIVEGFGDDVELVVRGESPMRYFQRAPRVKIRAGGRELATLQPDADFEWIVPVPAAALAGGERRVTIATDKWFIPDEVQGNGDRRKLGLRIYSVESRPRSATASVASR